MAEWVVEHGIGELRAALLDGDRILEARIYPEDELIAGTVLEARLVARFPERGQGIVAWAGGEALVAPLPAVTQGAIARVEIVRPALPEPGKPKRARARPTEAAMGTATPDLPQARAIGPHDADVLEAAGWSALLEEAATRHVAFAGGALHVALTPAMTLIDVDGTAAPAALALSGARAAAAAIRRLDISGSIGIDLPSVGDKAVRTAAADAIEAALPQPFERTAVNGFGFVQIVRPRHRRSLPELYGMEPALAHGRALLRRAERSAGIGERTLFAHPLVIAEITGRPEWTERLARALGAPVALRADGALAISAGHVQAAHA